MNLSTRFPNTKHVKHMLARAIGCSLLLVLPSCGIPQLNHAQPGRDLPVSFNGVTSSENSSQVPIEEFFNDPTLVGLIDQGLDGNQELKILAQNIQIANNEILGRRGAYLPFVTIGGSAGVAKPSFFTPAGAAEEDLTAANGQSFPTPLPTFMTAVNLSWQLDIWRQLRNARDAAVYRYFGTADGRNYVVTRLVAEIAENYFGLMALDKRIENLDNIIALQEKSLETAILKRDAAQGTELGVQRFVAEVRKNQSEKLIVRQEIIQVENRINFLLGRFPEPVDRRSDTFYELTLHALSLGIPGELLQYRPDIRQAERELEAAGLDVLVARANFYPGGNLGSGVGYEAFNMKYLFVTPESLIYNVAGELVAPLVNKKAIQAEYKSANARQLQACYNYQRIVLNAFTEVINRVTKVQNYTASIELKQQQLQALEASVDVATTLYDNANAEYIDVLFAQRDLMDARMVLIDTKREQLSAIVNTYQALGGGLIRSQYSNFRMEPVDASEPSSFAPSEDGLPLVFPLDVDDLR